MVNVSSGTSSRGQSANKLSVSVCVLDFQLMRCIAKIVEVVYPKMEGQRVAPLTPRRRTRSVSSPYDSPSPVPHAGDGDGDNAAEIDSSANANEVESEEETVKDGSPHGKVRPDDRCKETSDSAADPRDVGSGDHGSTETWTPESTTTTPRGSNVNSEDGKHTMTKMLFEILQNLLADVLAILDKVTGEPYVSTNLASDYDVIRYEMVFFLRALKS